MAVRVGYEPALAVAYVVQACAIALPVIGTSAIVAIASALLFGGTFMGIVTLSLTLAGRIAPDHSATTIAGLTAGFGLGQIVGPFFAGIFAVRAHSFSPALTMAAVCVLLGSILVTTLPMFGSRRTGT